MTEKEKFIRTDFLNRINLLGEDTKGVWGKMNAWQMMEHVTAFFKVSSAQIHFNLAVPEELLPKYKAFLQSDIPFKENTKAPASVLGEETIPVSSASFAEAKELLKRSVNDFFEYFEKNPTATTLHPAFGELNKDEWILLHYKHVIHHLNQFGGQLR